MRAMWLPAPPPRCPMAAALSSSGSVPRQPAHLHATASAVPGSSASNGSDAPQRQGQGEGQGNSDGAGDPSQRPGAEVDGQQQRKWLSVTLPTLVLPSCMQRSDVAPHGLFAQSDIDAHLRSGTMCLILLVEERWSLRCQHLASCALRLNLPHMNSSSDAPTFSVSGTTNGLPVAGLAIAHKQQTA